MAPSPSSVSSSLSAHLFALYGLELDQAVLDFVASSIIDNESATNTEIEALLGDYLAELLPGEMALSLLRPHLPSIRRGMCMRI
jgi:hypothetical protein